MDGRVVLGGRGRIVSCSGQTRNPRSTFWSVESDDYYHGFDGPVMLLGRHYHHAEPTETCFMDLLTGEVFDYPFSVAPPGGWRRLTEMEVIAWAAK